MTRKEDQKIDTLLHHYYREEMNNVDIPDSRRCWQDFQQLLEKKKEQGNVSAPFTTQEEKGGLYQFVRKYRNLTALAAACFLIVMLLGGMPPVQSLRQVLTGSLPQPGADRAKLMGTEEMAEEKLMLEDKESPGETRGRNDAPAIEDEGAGSFGIMGQDSMESAPMPHDEPVPHPPTEAGEMEELLPGALPPAEARELTFETFEQFYSTLKEYRELATGKLFYLGPTPQEFTFKRGIITVTESSLLALQQEFKDTEGTRLIVQQTFPIKMTMMIDEPTEKKPDEYTEDEGDYHIFMENGLNTLQWEQDDSMIAINAALDKDDLLAISRQMKVLE